MFERFTERARQVVVLAQEEARTCKHNYIGTEHILLGLLREEEGLAAMVLASLEITADRVREQVVRIVGSGEEMTSGQIPFTPRAKRVLELALREALSLGHNYIGTEHILLGLMRENEGVAVRVMLDFEADAEKIRNEVIRSLSGPAGRRAAEEASSVGAPPQTRSAAPARARVPQPAGPAFAGHVGHSLQRAAQKALAEERGVDDGDLLLALTQTSETLSGWALRRAGVDRAKLEDAVREVRELEAELQAVTEEKRRSIEAKEFEAAANARDRERRLAELRAADPSPGADDEG